MHWTLICLFSEEEHELKKTIGSGVPEVWASPGKCIHLF